MNKRTCRKAHLWILTLTGSLFWTSLALGAQSTSTDKGDEAVPSSLLNTRGVKVSQDLPPSEQPEQSFEFLNSLVEEALRFITWDVKT